EKNFEETLNIPSEQITKLTLDTPDNYHYKSTENQRKIKFFTDYLSQLTYERMLADRTGYMPDRASIIYLDGNNQSNFIVPYKKEVMINHKVYNVINGKIVYVILTDFLASF